MKYGSFNPVLQTSLLVKNDINIDINIKCIETDYKKSIFGKERAALYYVEIQNLVDKGYNEEDITAFLESYSSPIGGFYALLMIRRSELDVNDSSNLDILIRKIPFFRF